MSSSHYQVDQIFRGGSRADPDPAALLKYEFASAPTKVLNHHLYQAWSRMSGTKIDKMNFKICSVIISDNCDRNMQLSQARRLGGQPASIRSPFLDSARQNILSTLLH